MARKRYSDEDVLKLFCEIELRLSSGSDVASACRSAGLSVEYMLTSSQHGVHLQGLLGSLRVSF
jgi:hypothetical protein